jgi:hypothetical protein
VNNNISSRLFYPNPFQPTGIEFTLEETAIVTVKIIDGSGKEIETLIDHLPFLPGEHVVQYDPEKFKTGKYWYQITVTIGEKNFIETKQIV